MQDHTISNRHSDEIHDIITKVPSWIVRWGIVMFGVILLMTLYISAVIRYPDTLKLPIQLQTTNNPLTAFALVTIPQGHINKVKIGQPVLVRLTIYPSDKYKPIKGTVDFVPTEPNEAGLFIVKIKVTAPDASIKFKNWMTGNAEILTDEMTVFQRITKNLIQF